MMKEEEMGHNDGTHSPPKPMSKRYRILNRNGRYYYRQCVPTEIARALGKKRMDIKKSLKTGGLAKAERTAATMEIADEATGFARETEKGVRPARPALPGVSVIALHHDIPCSV